jgi:4-methyl-5(b-hydroxyethyl)-thiazole monophosphate biosynthesis
MPRVLVPLAEGFEELEAVTIIDILRRADVEVVTASLDPGPVRASRGTVLVADSTLEETRGSVFDMIVLPGGGPGTERLAADARVREMIVAAAGKGRHVAAICAAPKVLALAGLLDGRKATAYPGVLEELRRPGIRLEDAPVVVDGKIVTSRGPGTAMDFALTLVQILCGASQRHQVETALTRPAHHLATA